MFMPRALALAIVLAPASAGVAKAQSDVRTITIVSPQAPGGGVDAVARIIAEKLQTQLGQPVVVENRTGAAGIVGLNSVARAAPDGRMLVLMDISATLAKWVNRGTAFDVSRDFAPVALVANAPLLLFANPSVPANSVQELIAYAKANPGKLSVGTPGVGSPHHLAASMFDAAAGTEITHVPYRGTSPALTDLIGGQIPLIWATPIAVMPFVEKGQAKALGASSSTRTAFLPGVPTVAEQGLPQFRVDVWFGIAAPNGTAPEIVERLSRDIRLITDMPDVKKRMASLGFELNYLDRTEFGALIAADHERYGLAIKAAGLKPQ